MDFGDNHRRSIASALRYTEETLGTVETALTGHGHMNVLHCIKDDLTPLQTERISDRIHAIRSLIAFLKGSLFLEVEPVPLSRVVGGAASALWVTLVDTLLPSIPCDCRDFQRAGSMIQAEPGAASRA